MVESLKTGEVDGFCVGAPWNSAAVEQGLGHILHFGCEVVHPLTEKVLAARQDWTLQNEGVMIRLMRAVSAAAAFASKPENWDVCCERLAAPDRVGAGPSLIKRALSGSIKVSPSGGTRTGERYLILGAGGKGTARSSPGRLALLANGPVGARLPRSGSRRSGPVCVLRGPLRPHGRLRHSSFLALHNKQTALKE